MEAKFSNCRSKITRFLTQDVYLAFICSHILSKACPVRYHLSPERANLLRHLDFEGLNVPEVGVGMGGVSRFIAEQDCSLTVVEGTVMRYSCLRELRSLYERGSIEDARSALGAWIEKWTQKYPRLCAWVEENIEETLSFYHFPTQHHRRIRSTNVVERVNQEIKRRTRVVRIFPNDSGCLRLIRAILMELHEEWIGEAGTWIWHSLRKTKIKGRKDIKM